MNTLLMLLIYATPLAAIWLAVVATRRLREKRVLQAKEQAIATGMIEPASLHPIIARKLMREFNRPSDKPPTDDPLTEREMEVLRLVARGHSNQEIAEILSISKRTAGTHVGNILDKLHLANRTQAALYALREGLANLDED